MPITHHADEQDYDEAGMVAGMEQDFETLLAEKDNEIDMLKDEVKRLTNLLAQE